MYLTNTPNRRRAGYRTLRYRINDEWPGQSLSPPIEPMRVPREETIVQGGLQDVARADENASGQVRRSVLLLCMHLCYGPLFCVV